MSILHRIFVSKRKRKKITKKLKPVYKKFIGLKTLKAALPVTENILPDEEIRKIPRLKVIKKKRKSTKVLRKMFPGIRLIPYLLRNKEAAYAQTDITKFKDILSESQENAPLVEKFTAFLPRDVWDKMTYAQRGEHIKKRRAMSLSKHTKREKAKFAFCHRAQRPILAKLSFKYRRAYLKSLIKLASGPNHDLVPLENKSLQDKFILKGVKSTLRTKKQIKKKGNIYKNLTYLSLIPNKNAKLTK